MSNEAIISLIFIAITAILGAYICIKEIKSVRNSAPNGKKFIENFSDKLYDIYRAQLIAHKTFTVFKGVNFYVKVDKINLPEVPSFSSIPTYSSYDVYINDELVCREHVLYIDCNYKRYFEFSMTRKMEEIISLIDEVHRSARIVLDEDLKISMKKYNLHKESFFNSSEER